MQIRVGDACPDRTRCELSADARPGLRLVFHASPRRRALLEHSAGLAVWRAREDDVTPEPAATDALTDSMASRIIDSLSRPRPKRSRSTSCKPTYLAVTRERLMERIDDAGVAARAAGFLAKWIRDGVIIGIESNATARNCDVSTVAIPREARHRCGIC